MLYPVLVNNVAFFVWELHLYQVMRSKARLFLNANVVKQQQRQLSDLIDAVPDSVLICKKGDKESNMKALYANLKMNSFFGCGITDTKTIRNNSNGRYKRGVKGEPLKRKVFFKTDLNEPEQLSHNEKNPSQNTEDDGNSFSLIDIINENQKQEFLSLPKHAFERTVYKVVDPNPYAEDFQKTKILQIRVLDFLFED